MARRYELSSGYGRVHGFIPNGAPVAYQTVNPGRGDAFSSHHLFEGRGIPDNDMVVDLDPVDDRGEIGLPERNLAVDDGFVRCLPEPLDHFRRNFSYWHGWAWMRSSAT